ncbi:MAG: glycosyltransferase family 2 protein [Candidatus Gracilibacteria bacterium]|nr:glycosyltransferase family 2 protein [Candidatus Gracilibacteria bacterium]
MQKLSIIIPFLNEEKTIHTILMRIVALQNLNYHKEIILINDGSSDTSEPIIQEFIGQEYPHTSFVLLKNTKNQGKGFSCKEGIRHATGDVFIIQDADLEYNPDDYAKMLQTLEEKNLDMIYGSRNRGFVENGFHYSYVSFLLGGLFVSFVTSIFTGRMVTDEPTCYKMFRSHLREDLLLPEENGFEWEPAITTLLLRKGFRYGEIGIQYSPRKTIEGKKIKWIDGVKALVAIVKWRFKS